MRACLETQKLEQLEARMDEIADRVARDRTNAAHKDPSGGCASGITRAPRSSCSIRRRKRGVGGRSTLWPKSMLINPWR
jgi:hypothetical protein